MDHRSTVAAEVARIADRLRSMPLARLTPALREDVRGVAQQLVDATVDAGGSASSPPGSDRRRLPEVEPWACGDQLAVVGHDLLTKTADPRVLADTAPMLTSLRRRLP